MCKICCERAQSQGAPGCALCDADHSQGHRAYSQNNVVRRGKYQPRAIVLPSKTRIGRSAKKRGPMKKR